MNRIIALAIWIQKEQSCPIATEKYNNMVSEQSVPTSIEQKESKSTFDTYLEMEDKTFYWGI